MVEEDDDEDTLVCPSEVEEAHRIGDLEAFLCFVLHFVLIQWLPKVYHRSSVLWCGQICRLVFNFLSRAFVLLRRFDWMLEAIRVTILEAFEALKSAPKEETACVSKQVVVVFKERIAGELVKEKGLRRRLRRLIRSCPYICSYFGVLKLAFPTPAASTGRPPPDHEQRLRDAAHQLEMILQGGVLWSQQSDEGLKPCLSQGVKARMPLLNFVESEMAPISSFFSNQVFRIIFVVLLISIQASSSRSECFCGFDVRVELVFRARDEGYIQVLILVVHLQYSNSVLVIPPERPSSSETGISKTLSPYVLVQITVCESAYDLWRFLEVDLVFCSLQGLPSGLHNLDLCRGLIQVIVVGVSAMLVENLTDPSTGFISLMVYVWYFAFEISIDDYRVFEGSMFLFGGFSQYMLDSVSGCLLHAVLVEYDDLAPASTVLNSSGYVSGGLAIDMFQSCVSLVNFSQNFWFLISRVLDCKYSANGLDIDWENQGLNAKLAEASVLKQNPVVRLVPGIEVVAPKRCKIYGGSSGDSAIQSLRVQEPVAFNYELLQALPNYATLRVYCAGIWHNATCCAVYGFALLLLPLILCPFYIHGEDLMVLDVPSSSSLSGVVSSGDIITSLDGIHPRDVHEWMEMAINVHEQTLLALNFSDVFHSRKTHGMKGYCVPISLLEARIQLTDDQDICPDELTPFAAMSCLNSSMLDSGNLTDDLQEGWKGVHCLSAKDVVRIVKCDDGWFTSPSMNNRSCLCSENSSCLYPVVAPGLTWVEVAYLSPHSPVCAQLENSVAVVNLVKGITRW